MLKIIVPDREVFDEENLTFTTFKGGTIVMEHSLISLSKWEEEHKKPFLDPKGKLEAEDWIDYFKCMTISNTASDDIYYALNDSEWKQITDYINDHRSASTVKDIKEEGTAKNGGPFVTSELIYAWLALNKIPYNPVEKWHLSRTLILIRMVSEQRNPPKKKKFNQVAKDYAAMNKARRAKYNSKG